MLGLPRSVRIFLASHPTDMRRGFDGLAAQATALGADIYSGHLFAFISKRRNRVKVLWWDRGGFVLWYKRLERGRFRLPSIPADAEQIELDATQLTMLLDGIDIRKVRRGRFWAPPARKNAS